MQSALPSALAVFALGGAFGHDSHADDSILAADRSGRTAQEPSRSGPDDWTGAPAADATRAALDRGLAFLARSQARGENGSFPRDGENEWVPIGSTALGALAFMAAGNSPGRGPYGRETKRAIDFLVERCQLAPNDPEFGYISSAADVRSETHGHGYATLALAQAYGMTPHAERLGRALKAAVQRIEVSQGSDGGWYYSPLVVSDHEGSITICYVQALRAARNAGIQVDAEVIRRAEDYVVSLQKPDGTFRYKRGLEESTVALTAAAVTTLNMAGRYDDSVIRDAVDAILGGLERLRHDTSSADARRENQFPFYRRFYVAQALWQLSEVNLFERWFAEERERLLGSQAEDGSWRDRQFGNCYATAVNCLVLAIPEGVLPIFQR